MYKILSIDGGGIRGLIPAVWLEKLEEDLDEPLSKHFDLIAGTSTGAILAAGISAEIPASKLANLYKKMGSEVFPRPGFTRDPLAFLEYFIKPKYEDRPLGELLRDHFVDRGAEPIKLCDLNTNCMIVSYDALGRRPRIFCSWDDQDRQLTLWDVCKGSCSAPTYFPAHIMEIDNCKCPIIDGGVVANNPSSLALAHAVKLNRSSNLTALEKVKDIFLLSLGTGNLNDPITIQQAVAWGPAQWSSSILDVLFDGTSAADDITCEAILDAKSYIRFQVNLKAASEKIDEASGTNINHLLADASRYLSEDPGRHKYQDVLEVLKNGTSDKIVGQ